ncbi:MAG: TonB family protein [Ginsengibacter sp.]
MRVLFLLLSLLMGSSTFSQKIIGSAMADDKGITDKEKNAKFLIVEKQMNDTAFERLDYFFAGPMISRGTFKDKGLSILNGPYADYHTNGSMATSGQYVNNKKDGTWYVYDDTLKAITEYKFRMDSLVATLDMDSLDKVNKEIKRDTTGEVEAEFKGGTGRIRSIITSNFKVPERTQSLIKNGTVKVRFIVDTSGKQADRYLAKSVEFAFDEEALRVVALINNWIPASQKGRKVNAYRIQPISINLQ